MTPDRLPLIRALRLDILPRPVVIALVGAGGKSSFMFRLAAEVEGSNLRALFTTTTRLGRAQFNALPRPHFSDNENHTLALAAEIRPGRPVSIASGPLPAEDKVRGIPPQWVDRLAERGNLDLIVVEADGSRGKPLKAPDANEPVVPARTTLFLTVAGWKGVGKPLTPEWVHRGHRFATLARLAPGDTITPEALVRVLAHPEGGLKGAPTRARVLWCLNQVDTFRASSCAVKTARQILFRARGRAGPPPPSPPEVLITSLLSGRESPPTPVRAVVGRVAAVILAAGAGTRFGGPKQVAPWQGRPLIHHVLDAVATSQVDEVVVIVGAWARQVVEAVQAWQRARGTHGPPLRVVENTRWAEGQSTSVRAGLETLGPVSAALFPLADQPRISPALLDALIAAHRRTLAPIVRPRYPGGPGAPVLFDFTLFPDLLRLEGDTGGRAVVRAHPERVYHVEWPDPKAALDVDRPEDLAE